MSIQEAAQIGSPTAQAFLKQIQAEQKQAQDAALARLIEQQREAAKARSDHIESLRNQAVEAIAQYEQAKEQVESAVLILQRLDRQLPHDISNRLFPMQFRKINLPKPILGPHDDLHPSFSTMEARLMQVERF